jgi:hypothetical protein
MSLETKDIAAAFKRRPLLFVCGALCLALALCLYFRAGVPSELETRLAEREKELKRLTNNVKFAAQLEAQLQTLRRANEVVSAGALRPAELARNQQLFFRLEAESGVKLADIRQLAPPAAAKGAPAPVAYVPVSFSLTILGDYEQIIGFFLRLDHAAVLSRVTSASISRPEDGVQSLSLNVDLLGLRP